MNVAIRIATKKDWLTLNSLLIKMIEAKTSEQMTKIVSNPSMR